MAMSGRILRQLNSSSRMKNVLDRLIWVTVYNKPFLSNDNDYMIKSFLSEKEFEENLKNGAIEILDIVQTEDGKYFLRVYLSWSSSEHIIKTYRGQIKKWVSLDRLINQLISNYGDYLPIISLHLYTNGENNASNASGTNEER
ncbi:hypothetical protein [Thiolapillus sp.]|nr:hypothetical protein [Thiolapillus sp.]